MKINLFKIFSFLIISSVVLLGCTKDPSESNKSTVNTNSSKRSDCGVVINGALYNPPGATDGIEGKITQVVDAEFIIFQPNDPAMGPVLVKALAAQRTKKGGAESYINKLAANSRSLRLFLAGDDCNVTTSTGGRGALGTVLLPDGQIMTESLIKEGYLVTDSNTTYCSKRLIENCYDALAEQAPKEPETSDYTVNNFLWKPSADKDNNLVVLFSPSASRLTVNGSELTYVGASNGRASTFRGGRPGCSYGRATLKAWDRSGLLLMWPGGKTEYVVANGCQRTTF